jgi:hypothetical protein
MTSIVVLILITTISTFLTINLSPYIIAFIKQHYSSPPKPMEEETDTLKAWNGWETNEGWGNQDNLWEPSWANNNASDNQWAHCDCCKEYKAKEQEESKEMRRKEVEQVINEYLATFVTRVEDVEVQMAGLWREFYTQRGQH